MVNCGVEKYFSDQHYLSFCSDHHQKCEQSNNKNEELTSCKSDYSQNKCGERFVSHTQHANRKRDRAQKRREKKKIVDKQKRDEAKKLETKKDSLHIRTLKTKKRIISRDNVSTANAQISQRCDNVIELFTDRQETSSKSDELQNECGKTFVSHTQHANRKRDRAQKRREKKRIANKQKRDEAKKLETKKDYLHIRTLKTKERIISRDNVSITNAQTPQSCDNAIELFTNRQETSEKSDELQNECGQKFVSHTQHTNRKRDRAQKKRDKMRIANKQKRDEAKKLDREKNYLHMKYSGTKNRYTSRYNVGHAIEQRHKKCEQSSQMANLWRKRKLLEKMKRY